MQSQIVNDEFAQNDSGYYSSSQKRAIILWFVRLVLVFCVGGLILAYEMSNIWGAVIAFVSIAILATVIWQYSADLLLNNPTPVIGKVSKEIRQFRGPKRYDVLVGEEKMSLRALNKAQWQQVQDGVTYKIYYSPRTKWLLSFRPFTIEPWVL